VRDVTHCTRKKNAAPAGAASSAVGIPEKSFAA